MWSRSNRSELNRRSERGATLTGYALTMSVMVVVALGSMNVLQSNSETFLTDTGDEIGQAPIPASAAVSDTQASYAGGNSTGSGSYTGIPTNPIIVNSNGPAPVNTFSSMSPVRIDEFVVRSGANEFCIEPSAASAVVQPCPTVFGNTANQVSEYVGPSGYAYIAVGVNGAGDPVCLQRNPGGDLTNDDDVFVVECNNTDAKQRWLQVGSPASEYKDPDDPSRCLDVNGGISNGAQLITWSCHGGTNQEFVFGATPPPVPPAFNTLVAGPGALGINQAGAPGPTCLFQSGAKLVTRLCSWGTPIELSVVSNGTVVQITDGTNCVTAVDGTGSQNTTFSPCDENNTLQQFEQLTGNRYKSVGSSGDRCLDSHNWNGASSPRTLTTWQDCKAPGASNVVLDF